MRALYQATAVAAVILFVLGVKAVIPTPTAVAAAGVRMDVLQMHMASQVLPAQAIHDMTFAVE